MKKLFVLLLVLMMVLMFAACGGDETPSGGEDNPPSSNRQEQNNTPDSNGGENDPDDNSSERIIVDAELFDIADADIVAIKNGKTVLEGDEAAEVIAHIPAEIKKGVGELDADGCEVKANKDFTLFQFEVNFGVPNAAAESYYNALYEYYKGLDGTVSKDADEGDTHVLNMTFSWGELYRCDYIASYFDSDTAAIRVGFNINGN